MLKKVKALCIGTSSYLCVASLTFGVVVKYRQSSTMKEMDAQISNLRTSANARQELEERIHQLMKGSRRRSRLRHGRGGGQDIGRVGIDGTWGAGVDGGESTAGERSAPARASDARERVVAQRAHAEEVLQRKR